MKGSVRKEIWNLAQTGHYETWHGFAQRGQRNSPERASMWRSILKEVEGARSIQPGERILDIGCGLDTVLDFIPNVHGVTLDSLATKLQPLGLSREPAHTAGLLESLPFCDASFDRVFLMNVLDHVRDPFTGVAEIARVLKPDGLFILSVDTYAGRRYYEKRARKWYDRVRGARTKHPWVFSIPSVEHMLQDVGLRSLPARHVPGTKQRRSFFLARPVANG